MEKIFKLDYETVNWFITSLLVPFVNTFARLFVALAPVLFIILPCVIIITLLMVWFILVVFARRSFVKLTKEILCGNYKIAFSKRIKFTKWVYVTVSKTYPFFRKRIKQNVDNINGLIALSYLATGDRQNFLKYIEFIKYRIDFKEFWLCVYYLLNHDVRNAEEHYKFVSESNSSREYIDYLDALFLYEQGETEKAKEKMLDVYPKLKYKFSKEIAERIIDKK